MSDRGVVTFFLAVLLCLLGVMIWRITDLRDQLSVLDAERAFRNIEAETGRSCVPLLKECVTVLQAEVHRQASPP